MVKCIDKLNEKINNLSPFPVREMVKVINDNYYRKRLVMPVMVVFGLLLGGVSLMACTDTVSTPPPDEGTVDSGRYLLPTADGKWVPPFSPEVTLDPTETATVDIEGIGKFAFEVGQVQTVRPDIFKEGHFSVFDVLVHLAEKGDIELDYHFDGGMDTHIIDAINGQPFWWYQVVYSGGWYENNVFRMDMYPYKNRTQIRLNRTTEEYLGRICRTFGDEVARLQQNGGNVIVPEVTIRGINVHEVFTDVRVTAHSTRTDVLQPDVITALDILLSLGEQGELSRIKLTWYDSIGIADPVDSYWVEQIDADEAYGGCGFVYETGPREFSGFAGSHIHLPLDVRVIVSPEYALWFWICL